MEPLNAPDPLVLFFPGLKRQRLVFLILGLFFAAFSTGLWFLPVNSDGDAVARWILLPSFHLAAAGFLFFGVRPLDRDGCIRVLRAQPSPIVWYYVLVVRGPGRGKKPGLERRRELVVRLVNGKKAAIPLHGVNEQDVLALVHRISPRATAGYSEINEIRFQRDPKSLLMLEPSWSD